MYGKHVIKHENIMICNNVIEISDKYVFRYNYDIGYVYKYDYEYYKSIMKTLLYMIFI